MIRKNWGEWVKYIQGFGAGNFKALFESIELEQNERGNLFYTDVVEGGTRLQHWPISLFQADLPFFDCARCYPSCIAIGTSGISFIPSWRCHSHLEPSALSLFSHSYCPCSRSSLILFTQPFGTVPSPTPASNIDFIQGCKFFTLY